MSKTFRIYEHTEIGSDEVISHSTVAKDSQAEKLILTSLFETAKLVHEYEATCLVDAMQKSYDFFGYGEYHPMINPKTGKPYSEDFEIYP